MDTAKEIEQLGYSTVFFPDHFDEGSGPLVAMTVCAVATSTLNVGTLVFDCDYRHPAVLARELATLDQLAEGRLEVGHRRRVEEDRLRPVGHPHGPSRRPGRPDDRALRGAEGPVGRWPVQPSRASTTRSTAWTARPPPTRRAARRSWSAAGRRRLLHWAGATADIVGVNASIHSGEIDAAAAEDALADRIDEKVALGAGRGR